MRLSPALLFITVAAWGSFVAAGGPATRPAAIARPAAPTTLPVDPRKPYVHAPSGLTFPTNVGAFRRANVYRIDNAGRDVTAGYTDPTLKIVATVSVYPSRGVTAERHFKTIKEELLRIHTDAKATTDEPWTVKQGERELKGHRAAFQFIGPLAGVDQDLTTEAYLLALAPAGGGEAYFVKYRFTYPTADAKAALLRIGGFTEWLTLPDRAGPATVPSR